jgi:hypothetical protein
VPSPIPAWRTARSHTVWRERCGYLRCLQNTHSLLAACNLANFNSLVKVSFMGTPGASFPEIVQLFHFKTAHSSLKRSRRFTHALNPH